MVSNISKEGTYFGTVAYSAGAPEYRTGNDNWLFTTKGGAVCYRWTAKHEVLGM